VADARNVILPLSFALRQEERTPLYQTMVDLFLAKPDLEITEEQMLAQVRSQRRFHDQDLDERVRRLFITARAEALDEALEAHDIEDVERLKPKLFPKTIQEQSQLPAMAATWDSPLFRLLEERVDLARQSRATRLKSVQPPSGFSLPEKRVEAFALLSLIRGAKAVGLAEYLQEDESSVARSTPLVVSHRAKLVPHVGLLMACAMLDVHPSTLDISKERIVLSPPGRAPITIPVRTQTTRGHGRVDMVESDQHPRSMGDLPRTPGRRTERGRSAQIRRRLPKALCRKVRG
jgi:hypothetical protein